VADVAFFPLLSTSILPVAAVAGTVTTIWVAVAELILAATPLNVTVLLAATVLKFVPVIVTTAFGKALAGANAVMVTGIWGSTTGFGDFEQDMSKIKKAEMKARVKFTLTG
jgi:hypothetical protein